MTAVGPVVIQGNGLWIGWPGPNYKTDMPIPESSPDDASPSAGLLSSNIIPVEIEKSLMDNFYNGCCNATFWPLFHLMPDKAVFSIDYWQVFVYYLFIIIYELMCTELNYETSKLSIVSEVEK